MILSISHNLYYRNKSKIQLLGHLSTFLFAEKEKWTEKRILHICETYYDEDCGGMKYFAIAKYGMEFKQSELGKIQERKAAVRYTLAKFAKIHWLRNIIC